MLNDRKPPVLSARGLWSLVAAGASVALVLVATSLVTRIDWIRQLAAGSCGLAAGLLVLGLIRAWESR